MFGIWTRPNWSWAVFMLCSVQFTKLKLKEKKNRKAICLTLLNKGKQLNLVWHLLTNNAKLEWLTDNILSIWNRAIETVKTVWQGSEVSDLYFPMIFFDMWGVAVHVMGFNLYSCVKSVSFSTYLTCLARAAQMVTYLILRNRKLYVKFKGNSESRLLRYSKDSS